MNEFFFKSNWNVVTVLSICDLIVELKISFNSIICIHMGSQLDILPAMCDWHMEAVSDVTVVTSI